jgi:hypothetical protein
VDQGVPCCLIWVEGDGRREGLFSMELMENKTGKVNEGESVFKDLLHQIL